MTKKVDSFRKSLLSKRSSRLNNEITEKDGLCGDHLRKSSKEAQEKIIEGVFSSNILVKRELIRLSEPKYREFSSRLLPGTDHILGVRVPRLRALAKTLYRQNNIAALDLLSDDSFEEKMLQAFVIGAASLPIGSHLKLIRQMLVKLDNWSLVDSFVSSLKVVRSYPEEFYRFILPLLHDSQEFTVRFAIVVILVYLIPEELDRPRFQRVLELLGSVEHSGFYVKMAKAWAFSVCFTISSLETTLFLKKNSLDKFTHNKTIQKILESRKVSQAEKEKIKKLKKH